MAWVVPVMMVAGTLLSAQSEMQAGEAAAQAGESEREAANFEAAQLEQRGGQERAAAQRQAEDTRRQGRFASSRALALAAASGAGASDPSVVRTISDLDAETMLRSQLVMSAGEERAAGLTTGAASRRLEGRMAAAAGKARQTNRGIGASAGLLQGGTTLFERYG